MEGLAALREIVSSSLVCFCLFENCSAVPKRLTFLISYSFIFPLFETSSHRRGSFRSTRRLHPFKTLLIWLSAVFFFFFFFLLNFISRSWFSARRRFGGNVVNRHPTSSPLSGPLSGVVEIWHFLYACPCPDVLSFRTKKLEAGVGCHSLNKKKVQAIKIDVNHEKPTDG